MQLLKWFSLIKDVVMCNKNLRLKSPLKVCRPLEFIKHGNFDFIFFGDGGVDSYLQSDFQESRMTKFLILP